jgi:hypothetical protein
VDGQHTHGHGGGGIDPAIIGALLVIVGIAIVGPVILAIIQALITLLLIILGVSVAAIATYLALRVRSHYTGQAHPLQQRGNGRTIPSPSKPRAITASREGVQGHIILTDEEYEKIRRERYGN